MRTIKFRAWDNNNSEMIHFYELSNNPEMLRDILTSGDKLYVYPMQFTGLHDKNGKEIYEGDILSDKWKAEVYHNDEGTFMVKFKKNQKVNKPMSLKKYLIAREMAGTSNCEGYIDCIVIGNIYENPELLETFTD